mmetsp:Transcript_99917/g.287132  ORF Transcript_99917/g.287132 Transcript_99917/m.287132 type:complete len:433 (+) Transcript_99917:151-1449(+)
MCIFRHRMFSCLAASTQPSFAASVLTAQFALRSSSPSCMFTSTMVGVLLMNGSSPVVAVSTSPAEGLSSFTSSSSLFSWRSSAKPHLLDTRCSMTTSRCSLGVKAFSSSRVFRPRHRIMVSKENTVSAAGDNFDVGGFSGSTASTEPSSFCFCITLHAMFSRRAASIASSAAPALAIRVDNFQLPLISLHAPRSCRNPMIDGPNLGMDMSHRNSLYVSSLPANSCCKASLPKTSPKAWRRSSQDTVPLWFLSKRLKSSRKCWSSRFTCAERHAARKAEYETWLPSASAPDSANAADNCSASASARPPSSVSARAKSAIRTLPSPSVSNASKWSAHFATRSIVATGVTARNTARFRALLFEKCFRPSSTAASMGSAEASEFAWLSHGWAIASSASIRSETLTLSKLEMKSLAFDEIWLHLSGEKWYFPCRMRR